MGRATYSSRNAAKSVSSHSPSPSPGLIWDSNSSEISAWRVARFDPDGDDFFRDAEYEAPLNPDDVRQQSADQIAQMVQRAISPDSASDTSSDTGSESGMGDRVLVRPQGQAWPDPARRGSEAVSNRTLATNQEALASHVELVRSYPELVDMFDGPPQAPIPEPRPQNSDNTRGRSDLGHVLSATRSSYQPRSPASAIPAMYVPVTTGPTMRVAAVDLPEQIPVPTAPRPVMASAAIVPTTVGRASPRTPSPTRVRLAQLPETPVSDGDDSLIAPSPPGSVTPAQVYTWRPTTSVPSSPTPRIRASNINRDSPLTNPRARMSYARLVHVNPPVFVHRGAN
ncbi:hypothetical protein BKA70DRAFT_471013 [Coprinopsis sp. MPI-PUGE-AT-0042]|nr:hypothetical protein BKA70DRAFT_471013 [Coprinopsis sp. MPI-PUGE-AT-0042]